MAIIIFISLFTALIVAFVMEENLGLSMAEVTVDNVRTSIIRRLNAGGRRAKLRNLQKEADVFFKKALIIGGMSGTFMFLVTLGTFGIYSMAFLLVGVAVSVFIAEYAINQEYKKWQEDMIEGIPGLIDFLPAFLETPGITTRAALEYTIPFIPSPLGEEFEKTLNIIKRTGKAEEALTNLADRVRHPVMGSVCVKLATTWDTVIDADLFSGLHREVANVEKMAAARATAKKKSLLVIVVLVGILGMVLLIGFPILLNTLNSVSSGFGA